MVRLVRHPQTKGRETDRLNLNHRATSRLYRRHDEHNRQESKDFFKFFRRGRRVVVVIHSALSSIAVRRRFQLTSNRRRFRAPLMDRPRPAARYFRHFFQ